MASPRYFGFLLMMIGCTGATAKGPSLVNGRPAASQPHFPDARSVRVRSRTLDLPIEVMLPERASWRVTDGPTWLEAEQRESSSTLALRTWRAERLVRRSDCAAQARLARPTIPIASEESIVDQRSFAAPAGFDSELVVGVEPSGGGVMGYAIVFGASVGYCYAALFTTTASGSGADQEVAARLGVAVDGILSGVRARSIDERAVRRRLVVTPAAPPSRARNETQ
jgi:hypothetical protein